MAVTSWQLPIPFYCRTLLLCINTFLASYVVTRCAICKNMPAVFLFLLLAFHPAPSSAFASGGKSQGLVDADSATRHEMVQSRVRFRGRIAYDGTGYDGWQVQPKRRTVQGELESVLSRRFNRTIRAVGAGRTDAGVHARGQAFHFDLEEGEIETREDEMKLQRALNSMLRRDTRIWNVGRAPKAVKKIRDDGTTVVHRWHVIYESTKKFYSYRYVYVIKLQMPCCLRYRRHIRLLNATALSAP